MSTAEWVVWGISAVLGTGGLAGWRKAAAHSKKASNEGDAKLIAAVTTGFTAVFNQQAEQIDTLTKKDTNCQLRLDAVETELRKVRDKVDQLKEADDRATRARQAVVELQSRLDDCEDRRP